MEILGEKDRENELLGKLFASPSELLEKYKTNITKTVFTEDEESGSLSMVLQALMSVPELIQMLLGSKYTEMNTDED